MSDLSTDQGSEPSPAWPAGRVPLAPLGNEHIVGVASGRVLDVDQCRGVVDAVAAASSAPTEAPTVTTPVGQASVPAAMLGQPLPADVAGWLLPVVAQAATIANNQHFRFELTGLLASDPPLVVRLDRGDEGLDGRLFSDLLPVVSTRKLTLVLPLDDGTGGVPEFPALAKACTDVAGELSIFPSYLSYRFLPVTAGPRSFLWARVHGPHFR